MAYGQVASVTLTTDASGNATGYIDAGVGYLQAIKYTKVDFADGVDFTITGETSGQTLWAQNDVNASATVYPRAATHTTAGAAALYASGGVAVLDKIFVAERIKVVVASGGNTKTGTFTAVVGG